MSLLNFYNSDKYIKVLLTFISLVASFFTIGFITILSLGFFVFGPREDLEREKYRKENHYISHENQMDQMDQIIDLLKKLKKKSAGEGTRTPKLLGTRS